MLTKLILKVSLFATFITFVYCILTNVSVIESASRAATVFVGFYFILIAFFITLRLLLGSDADEETSKEVDTSKKTGIEKAAEAEIMGVASEQ